MMLIDVVSYKLRGESEFKEGSLFDTGDGMCQLLDSSGTIAIEQKDLLICKGIIEYPDYVFYESPKLCIVE